MILIKKLGELNWFLRERETYLVFGFLARWLVFFFLADRAEDVLLVDVEEVALDPAATLDTEAEELEVEAVPGLDVIDNVTSCNIEDDPLLLVRPPSEHRFPIYLNSIGVYV